MAGYIIYDKSLRVSTHGIFKQVSSTLHPLIQISHLRCGGGYLWPTLELIVIYTAADRSKFKTEQMGDHPFDATGTVLNAVPVGIPVIVSPSTQSSGDFEVAWMP